MTIKGRKSFFKRCLKALPITAHHDQNDGAKTRSAVLPAGWPLTSRAPADNLCRIQPKNRVSKRSDGETGRSQMSGRDSIQSLLVLRKVTRAIADVVRAQMAEHLATLTPLLRPTAVLGDYVQGGQKETTRKADKAYRELESLYQSVCTGKPFNLPRELTPPLNILSTGLEITAYDYPHTAKTGGDSRTIMVRSPLTWTLTYTGFGPGRLQELLNTKMRSNEEVLKVVVAYLAMHVVVTNQPGLLKIFEALHFPITTVRTPEFGDLPVTRIGASVVTNRPADAVVIESAELTGMNAFEEVVDVDEISRLRDPLREVLMDVARQHAPELVSR
jgi:hypothetical protein